MWAFRKQTSICVNNSARDTSQRYYDEETFQFFLNSIVMRKAAEKLSLIEFFHFKQISFLTTYLKSGSWNHFWIWFVASCDDGLLMVSWILNLVFEQNKPTIAASSFLTAWNANCCHSTRTKQTKTDTINRKSTPPLTKTQHTVKIHLRETMISHWNEKWLLPFAGVVCKCWTTLTV